MLRAFQILSDRLEQPRIFGAAAALLAIAGVALRLLWVRSSGHLAATNSEMLNVSRTFATTGHLADAYAPGSGLTAHVTPVMPFIAGTVYRLFGATSLVSEMVLIALALAFVGLSVWGIDRAMARLGTPAAARLLGLAVFALAPLNFSGEMRDARVWEGAVAAAGLAGALAYVVTRDNQDRRFGWRDALLLAAGGGLMALASPPAALAIYGLLGLLALRRRGVLALAGSAALSAALLVAICYPWALRNEAVFHQKVWSRTNFGFNFALGFYDGAVNPADPRRAFVDRLKEVDPYANKTALATLQSVGGELAYSHLWTDRTKTWVAAHPADAARIAVRHLVQFYFPPRWFWSIYGDTAKAVAPRQAVIWMITALGGLWVAWRLAARDWRYLYVLAALTLPALPYILAQPVLRYRYPIAALMTYLFAALVWRLLAGAKRAAPTAEVAGAAAARPAEI